MKKSSRIQTNLLQQNVFVRDCARLCDLAASSVSPTFISLDEVVTPKGVDIKEVENAYPITPEYVDSFVDSSDYRNNLSQAIQQSVLRGSSGNLGDIRGVQEIMSMNDSDARILYKSLCERFAQSVPSSGAQPTPQPGSQPSPQPSPSSPIGGEK